MFEIPDIEYRNKKLNKYEENRSEIIMGFFLQGIAIMICLLMMLGLFRMMKKKKLSENKALIWLLGTLGLLILSCFPDILKWIAGLLGIWWAPAALIFFLLIVIILIVFYHTLAISKFESQIMEMAMQIALLKEKNNEMEKKPQMNQEGMEWDSI